jgi:hypothetical protein
MSAQILTIGLPPQDSAEGDIRCDQERLFQHGEENRLGPARGVAIGLVVSIVIWMVIGALIYALL